MCYVVRKTTLELEHMILTTLYPIGATNTDSWCTRKGDLQRSFPLDISIVPSSVLFVAADNEHLSCDCFSLIQTIRFGSLKFIAECFRGLSLSPRGDGSDAIIMGSTQS
jgi:hypothetical protein